MVKKHASTGSKVGDSPKKAEYWKTVETPKEIKLLEHRKKEHNAELIGEEVAIKEWKDKIRVWKE
eukprot:13510040-Ditylum_brightwellii.AAC.1